MAREREREREMKVAKTRYRERGERERHQHNRDRDMAGAHVQERKRETKRKRCQCSIHVRQNSKRYARHGAKVRCRSCRARPALHLLDRLAQRRVCGVHGTVVDETKGRQIRRVDGHAEVRVEQQRCVCAALHVGVLAAPQPVEIVRVVDELCIHRELGQVHLVPIRQGDEVDVPPLQQRGVRHARG